MPSACLDENFSIRTLRRYFDGDGWEALNHVVQEKSKHKVFECGTCSDDTENTYAVQCDSCLVWNHMKCLGKKIPQRPRISFAQGVLVENE